MASNVTESVQLYREAGKKHAKKAPKWRDLPVAMPSAVFAGVDK
jgi:hypothetical protein